MGKKKFSKAGKKKTTKAKKPTKAAAVKKSAKGRSTKGNSAVKKTKKRKSTGATTSGRKKTTRPLPDPAKKRVSKRTLGAVKSAPGQSKPRDNSRSAPKAAAPAKKRRIASGELAKIRTLLSTKKVAISNHLQSELAELEKPEKRHRADLEEIASDTHDTDSLCQMMDIEATQIDQIDMALAKIENGTYGICEDCSDEIPLARLEALPFATQCIECKRKAEIAGQISALGS